MYYLLFLVSYFFFSYVSLSGLTLLSEDFEGDFPDLWVVMPSTDNYNWQVGSATQYTGEKSIYVTANINNTNYGLVTFRTIHFYRDISFPANAQNINLSFYLRCGGEVNELGEPLDYLRVYLQETNFIPSINPAILPPCDNIIGDNFYNLTDGQWLPINISIPDTVANTEKRLIFTWRNNMGGGQQPGACIDDIVINYDEFINEGEEVYKPSQSKLVRNYPNPFNSNTTIEFSIQCPVASSGDFQSPLSSSQYNLATGHWTLATGHSQVTIDIYNIKGQKVRSLINGEYRSGTHNVIWNGQDDAGINVPSGIYFCRMKADDYTQVKKLVVMK